MPRDKGGVSHLDENKQDELMGVTTPPSGKRSEQCEVQNKAASVFNLEDSQLQQLRTDEQGTREYEIFRQLERKMFIDHSAENLKQEALQNEATRREVDRVKTATRVEQDRAKVEQDRVTTFTRMEADRVTTFASEDAYRHIARRKRQLRQQLEMLKLQQQYLGEKVTDMSTIPEHGGGDRY